jgi:dihydroorotate dehydrogenase (NAD+) catalytic subunit
VEHVRVFAQPGVEFLLAGARALSVGTAIFTDPQAPVSVARGIAAYLEGRRLSSVQEIIGKVRI